MSIYIFKTEEYFGGETRVFTNKFKAINYLKNFLDSCATVTDAHVEEHKPVHNNESVEDVTFEPLGHICECIQLLIESKKSIYYK